MSKPEGKLSKTVSHVNCLPSMSVGTIHFLASSRKGSQFEVVLNLDFGKKMNFMQESYYRNKIRKQKLRNVLQIFFVFKISSFGMSCLAGLVLRALLIRREDEIVAKPTYHVEFRVEREFFSDKSLTARATLSL